MITTCQNFRNHDNDCSKCPTPTKCQSRYNSIQNSRFSSNTLVSIYLDMTPSVFFNLSINPSRYYTRHKTILFCNTVPIQESFRILRYLCFKIQLMLTLSYNTQSVSIQIRRYCILQVSMFKNTTQSLSLIHEAQNYSIL